jgi:hypothetical protein
MTQLHKKKKTFPNFFVERRNEKFCPKKTIDQILNVTKIKQITFLTSGIYSNIELRLHIAMHYY